MRIRYRVLDKAEKAHWNMEAVCIVLNALCETETTYEVRDVYFDLGQDWMWTTICNNRNVQVLDPVEWLAIVKATNGHELAEVVRSIRAGKYFKE